MKFGIPVWYGNKPLEKAFRKAKRLGFDYVELSLDYPLHPNKRLIELLARVKRRYGLGFAFHLPIPELNLCHPSKEISEPALTLCKKFIGSLSSANPLYINLHLHAMIMTAKFREVWRDVVKRAKEVATQLDSFSKAHNFLLTFENGTSRSTGRNLNELNFLWKKNLNFCLDVGHAAATTASLKRRKINTRKFLRALDKLQKIVRVVHLHDVAIVENDIRDHLALNSGKVNLNEVIDFIKGSDCRYLLLEIFYSLKNKGVVPVKVSDLKSSLNFVKERL